MYNENQIDNLVDEIIEGGGMAALNVQTTFLVENFSIKPNSSKLVDIYVDTGFMFYLRKINIKFTGNDADNVDIEYFVKGLPATEGFVDLVGLIPRINNNEQPIKVLSADFDQSYNSGEQIRFRLKNRSGSTVNSAQLILFGYLIRDVD